MKKIINLLIIVIATLCLFGCENNQTGTGPTDGPGNGNGGGNQETPAVYPYMDYFENDVYAMKFGGNSFLTYQVLHGVYKDSEFVAVGKAGMADVTAATPYSFNDKDYGGLCFTAKTGIELKSITFTIVAEKECYLLINLYGPKLDESGNPSFSNNYLNTVASSVAFKDSNFTTLDGTKLIKLTPNTPLTFTVDTLREDNEFDNKSSLDFGKITEACASDDTTRRFLLSLIPYFINNGFLSSQYTSSYFEEANFGIRLYNISFDVVKL